MPMAEAPMAVKATESDEAGTEMMMATEVMMATEPEPNEANRSEAMTEPAVNLLNQRRGLYLPRHASNGSRHR